MKTKPAKVVRMLVVVPRIDGLTIPQHRKAVREALRQTGDFYRRQVRVSRASE